MRRLALLFLLLGLAACRETFPKIAPDPRTVESAVASAREYLLQSAASDFHAHGPEPASFRNVRFGYVEGAGNSQMALLCGEVEPATGPEAGKWIAFSTVKTSAYEQVIGDRGGFCARPTVGWEPGDLSSELLRRVDSLR
jgi:hypothetical protein